VKLVSEKLALLKTRFRPRLNILSFTFYSTAAGRYRAHLRREQHQQQQGMMVLLIENKRSSLDSLLRIAQLYLHVIFFVLVVGVSSSLPSGEEYNNPVIMAVNTSITTNTTNASTTTTIVNSITKSSIENWNFSNSSSFNRTAAGTSTVSSSDGVGLSEPQKRKKRRKKFKDTTTTTITRNASVDKDDHIIRHEPNTTVESISMVPTYPNASSFYETSTINASMLWNESASIGQQPIIQQTILPKTHGKKKKIKKRLSSKENPQYNAPTEKSSAIPPNNSTTTSTTIAEHHEDPTKSIRVSCLTWNLAEESPSPSSIPSTFLSKFQRSDFVLVSIQECETIQPRRTEGRRSRFIREYCVQNLCGPTMQYVPIAMHSLGGMQLLLFCKRHWLSHLRNVQCCDVACGIGNTFHNKGAIGAFVTINHPSLLQQQQQKQKKSIISSSRKRRKNDTANDLTLLFVSAHLEAHIHNVEGRNNNFWRILTEFSSQAPIYLKHKTANRSTNVIKTSTTTDAQQQQQQQREEGHDNAILHQTDCIFFCGDLNYRLDLPREMVEHHIILQQRRQTADWLPLLRHDQLLSTISQGKAFPFFQEGKITFAPTFKLDPFSFQTYDTSSKQRIPAWTDRILFLSNPPHTVKVLEYDSVPHATHSDHRPVYGTFLLQKRATSTTSKHP